MVVDIVWFALGLAALVAGAELLVRGASGLALSFGISPLVVGLTIVAFGTSAPEVAVSVGAVPDGKTDLAIGNVVGSNVFNVLFILGVSALITPLVVNIQLVRQEVPIMIGASLLLLLLGLDGTLGLWDCAFLDVHQIDPGDEDHPVSFEYREEETSRHPKNMEERNYTHDRSIPCTFYPYPFI